MHDLDLVVVMLALKLWRHYLVRRSFVPNYDPKRLKNLFVQRDLNVRQRKLSQFMSKYNFGIYYIKGKDNVVLMS